MRGARRILAASAAVLLLPAVSLARGRGEPADRLPVEAAVSVRWGKPAGSEAFRRDLERSVAETMSERCFARVVPPGGDPARSGADVLVEIVLSNVEDETVFDGTLAKALDPDDPDRGMGQTARFSVDVAAKLVARKSGAVVITHDLHAAGTRRPLAPGEDIRAYARSEAIETVTRDLVRTMCGDKADRKIRRALAPAGPAR